MLLFKISTNSLNLPISCFCSLIVDFCSLIILFFLILNQEKKNILQIIENSKNGLKNLDKEIDNDSLNPTKRKLGGFKEDDVFKIIEYTKGLEHKVVILSTDNDNKDLMIDKLTF